MSLLNLASLPASQRSITAQLNGSNLDLGARSSATNHLLVWNVTFQPENGNWAGAADALSTLQPSFHCSKCRFCFHDVAHIAISISICLVNLNIAQCNLVFSHVGSFCSWALARGREVMMVVALLQILQNRLVLCNRLRARKFCFTRILAATVWQACQKPYDKRAASKLWKTHTS